MAVPASSPARLRGCGGGLKLTGGRDLSRRFWRGSARPDVRASSGVELEQPISRPAEEGCGDRRRMRAHGPVHVESVVMTLRYLTTVLRVVDRSHLLVGVRPVHA